LAQRAWTKKHNPGKRWPAVAWTVAQGETYEENILHEIYEEIGLQVTLQDITLWDKKYVDYDWCYFCQWFFLTYTWPKDALCPEVRAVEQLRRYTKEELKTYLLTHPDEYLLSIHTMLDLL
jgi:8-oxo-dGTP pyrophosphatase MutT (NUDIX family)